MDTVDLLSQSADGCLSLGLFRGVMPAAVPLSVSNPVSAVSIALVGIFMLTSSSWNQAFASKLSLRRGALELHQLVFELLQIFRRGQEPAS